MYNNLLRLLISIVSYLQIFATIYLNFCLHFLNLLLNLASAELFLFQLLFSLLPLAAYFSNLHSKSLDTPVNIAKEHTTINTKEVNKITKAFR